MIKIILLYIKNIDRPVSQELMLFQVDVKKDFKFIQG